MELNKNILENVINYIEDIRRLTEDEKPIYAKIATEFIHMEDDRYFLYELEDQKRILHYIYEKKVEINHKIADLFKNEKEYSYMIDKLNTIKESISLIQKATSFEELLNNLKTINNLFLSFENVYNPIIDIIATEKYNLEQMSKKEINQNLKEETIYGMPIADYEKYIRDTYEKGNQDGALGKPIAESHGGAYLEGYNDGIAVYNRYKKNNYNVVQNLENFETVTFFEPINDAIDNPSEEEIASKHR